MVKVSVSLLPILLCMRSLVSIDKSMRDDVLMMYYTISQLYTVNKQGGFSPIFKNLQNDARRMQSFNLKLV